MKNDRLYVGNIMQVSKAEEVSIAPDLDGKKVESFLYKENATLIKTRNGYWVDVEGLTPTDIAYLYMENTIGRASGTKSEMFMFSSGSFDGELYVDENTITPYTKLKGSSSIRSIQKKMETEKQTKEETELAGKVGFMCGFIGIYGVELDPEDVKILEKSFKYNYDRLSKKEQKEEFEQARDVFEKCYHELEEVGLRDIFDIEYYENGLHEPKDYPISIYINLKTKLAKFNEYLAELLEHHPEMEDIKILDIPSMTDKEIKLHWRMINLKHKIYNHEKTIARIETARPDFMDIAKKEEIIITTDGRALM